MNAVDPTQRRVGVIVVAGGLGQRLGLGIPKARVLCGGISLLERAVGGVLVAGAVEHIVVVVPPGDLTLGELVTTNSPKNTTITAVPGGTTRADSVRAGLAALPADLHWILVHDAARSLTPATVFHRVLAGLGRGNRAVIPALDVPDTIKTVRDGLVTGTLERAALRAVQTPQGFDAPTLRAAHNGPNAREPGVTDDAMLVELQGIPVLVVAGDQDAFKITTPRDLLLAEALLGANASAQESACP